MSLQSESTMSFGRVALVIGNAAVMVSARGISLKLSPPTLDGQQHDDSQVLTKMQSQIGNVDVYYSSSDMGTYSSTSPVMFSPMLYLVGGLLAIMALFLALATQKEKKLTSPARNSNPPLSPSASRKVRWRLGDSSSDDEPPAKSNSNTSIHSYYTRGPSQSHIPSYDGCYYGADPQDNKTPSPQSSRRYFH